MLTLGLLESSEIVPGSIEHTGELVAKTLELHDVDNNLIISDKLTEIILRYLEEAGGSPKELNQIKREVEGSGGSFDTLSEMRRLYDNNAPGLVDEVMRKVKLEVEARRDLPYEDPNCLFISGARELIRQQPPAGTQRAYVTRGGDELQRFKLENVMKVNMQRELYAILPPGSKEMKSDMCVKSFHAADGPNGEFVFRWLHNAPEGGVRVQSVLVTDDKAEELVGLEKLGKERALGYWHRTGDNKSQRLKEGRILGDNIFEIRSFQEVGQFWRRTVGALALGSDQDWIGRNRI